MSSLRFVERNGKMILQQSTSGRVTTDSYGKVISDEVYWQDVPVHKEPEKQKPRTIADNIRDGAYSDWSRQELKQQKPREFWLVESYGGSNNIEAFFTSEKEANEWGRVNTDFYKSRKIHVTEIKKGYKLLCKKEVLDIWAKLSKDYRDNVGIEYTVQRFILMMGFDE